MDLKIHLIWLCFTICGYVVMPSEIEVVEGSLAEKKVESDIIQLSSSVSPPKAADLMCKVGEPDMIAPVPTRSYTWLTQEYQDKNTPKVKELPSPILSSVKWLHSQLRDDYDTYYGLANKVLENCKNDRIRHLAHLIGGLGPPDVLHQLSSQSGESNKSIFSAIDSAIHALEDGKLLESERVWALGVLQSLQYKLFANEVSYIQRFPYKYPVSRGELELSLIKVVYPRKVPLNEAIRLCQDPLSKVTEKIYLEEVLNRVALIKLASDEIKERESSGSTSTYVKYLHDQLLAGIQKMAPAEIHSLGETMKVQMLNGQISHWEKSLMHRILYHMAYYNTSINDMLISLRKNDEGFRGEIQKLVRENTSHSGNFEATVYPGETEDSTKILEGDNGSNMNS